MKFRPCIDLLDGRVSQVVGSTLNSDDVSGTTVNFSAETSARSYAEMYDRDRLFGGHVIKLGQHELNEVQVREALEAFPGGLQVGGGINADNCRIYLEQGASHVIVTSFVFKDGQISLKNLTKLEEEAGRKNLVLDLSCRRKESGSGFFVCTDRWKKFTDFTVDADNIALLADHCDEFLVHGIDVEGKQQGIEEDLVRLLGEQCKIPVTYAGGVRSLDDMDHIESLGLGRVDATIGSALDVFGGELSYEAVVKWHRARNE